MKQLIILTRIVIVGLIWSIFFVEGIRVIMLTNWRFDIFQIKHWHYAWNLWYSGQWVISDSKEWAFVLIILSFIPLWLTGWAALSLIRWEKIISKICSLITGFINIILRKQVHKIKTTAKIKSVSKKKSYKEIRPRNIRSSINELPLEPMPSSKPITHTPKPYVPKTASVSKPQNFEHSLFKIDDDEEDFEFNFDAFDTSPKKEEPKNPPSSKENKKERDNKKNRNDRKEREKDTSGSSKKSNKPIPPANKPTGNSILDVLIQKGYEVITGATIKNNHINFIGISKNKMCICLVDKEAGDWLADEERFNDEEPLWFSESSHRISPVRKIYTAREAIREKLSELEGSFEVKAYIIVQIGNIINAEDMFETWDEMDISVTRIDRGSPKELKLFSRTLDEAVEPISKDKFEKIKKVIRNIS